MSKSIEEMSGPELVAEFNRLSPTKVKKFKDRASGIKRIKSLASGTSGKKSTATPAVAGVVGEFGVREKSNRAKLLGALGTGKQIPLGDLLAVVYGSRKEEMKSALTMVMKGLSITIQANKLKYEIKREKTKEGGISYGLYRTN